MISVIIPLFKGETLLPALIKSILQQHVEDSIEFIFPITRSQTISSTPYPLPKNATVFYLDPHEFNHATTRERAARKAQGEILLFLTQDIMPTSTQWLKELLTPIKNKQCDAAFSRQIAPSHAHPIESLFRLFNYPENSRFSTLENAHQFGRKTIFCSDSCFAISKKLFFQLGGYSTALPLSEESLLAARLIQQGYTLGYIATSTIYHAHPFKWWKVKKYFFIGQVEQRFHSLFSPYKTHREGVIFLNFAIKKILKTGSPLLIIPLLSTTLLRYFSFKLGQLSIFFNRTKKK